MARDVGGLLEDLGLGKYLETFVANDVDFDVLRDLRENDLERLGLSLGHRKKLLRAITALEAEPGADSRSGREIEKIHEQIPAVVERRQLTVMFVDLVGSTALSGRLDPEDMREIIVAYQNAVAGEVARFEGHVAKFMGDGVLAYFGWPRAHEDEAERAVRAGLAIIETVGKLATSARESLAARVGIATGLVVVGDLIGEGAAQEEAVVGETPNLAARLQALAEPGEVVVGEATRRLLANLFDLDDLGPHELKGFAAPVNAWRVVGESRTEGRFEALHGSRLSPLVGRDQEFALLLDRWRLAKGGEGQAVLLSGESGIGKSRLVRELSDAIRDERHFHLLHQCSPHHTNTALHPVIRRLEKATGISAADTVDAKLDKLEALLREATPNIGAIAPLFADFLSIPAEGRYGALDLTPQQRRDRSIEALASQVLALSRQRPVLFTVEDAHWIDSMTESLIAELMARVTNAAVIVLITHRSDYEPPWTGHPHLTSVTLNRLSRGQGRKFAQSIGGDELIESAIDRIVARAEGLPLHIEELSKSLLESPTPAEDAAIPTTLKASMMARLDRLGSAKQVAQVGSVIGREFSYPLIVELSHLSKDDTDAALARMVKSGLLYQHGTAPAASYQFKHMLVQDAAYDSLLKRRRRQLHVRIATLLEEHFPGTVEFEPELLAYHWEQGQKVERALDYRLRAARKADKLFALWEAVTHYLRAVELIEQLAETPETRRRFLETLLSLADVRGEFWRNAAEQRRAHQHVEKALAVAREISDVSAIARLEAFEGTFWMGEQLLAEAMAHAEASGDDATRAEVAMANAGYLGFAGRFEQSLAHTKRAIRIFEQLGDQRNLGIALAGTARCYSARAGLLGESLQFADAARRIAADTGNLIVKSWLPMEAEPLMYKGLWERTVEVAEEGLPVAREIGDWFVVLYISAWAAISYLKLDRLEDARRMVDEAVKTAAQQAAESNANAYRKIVLSQVLLAEGKFDEARRIGREALEQCERGGIRLEQGFACRTLGQVHAADGNASQAEAFFRHSLEILSEIQSQPELAQTLLTYGRFQRGRNPEDGMRMQKRALALFEAMGATGWIEEAVAALRDYGDRSR
jgi:class 3 adenylate cyclase/tetratricopeptide (TPR) repeat protein